MSRHRFEAMPNALAHRQIGDVGAPDLVGPVNPQPAQKVGVGLVPLGGLAGIGLLVDRHQAHKAHQSPDALFVHGVALVLQVPRHLPDAIERGAVPPAVDLTVVVLLRGAGRDCDEPRPDAARR